MIELPDGDGVFSASSITVTSGPAALGYTFPLDIFATANNGIVLNSFTVTGGEIVDSDFLISQTHGGLSFALLLLSAGSNNNSAFAPLTASASIGGVVDLGSTTLEYTSVVPAVPLPASVLLLGAGLFGLVAVGRRKTTPAGAPVSA